MSRMAAVPVVRGGESDVNAFAAVVKQIMDWQTGQQKNAPVLTELPSTATLAQVIEQVNLQRRRLEG